MKSEDHCNNNNHKPPILNQFHYAWEMNVENAINQFLTGLDEDIASYLRSVIDDIPENNRKSAQILFDAISPFLLDSGYCTDDNEAMQKCRQLAVYFGGSGLSTSNIHQEEDADDDIPVLLSAPVKIKAQSQLEGNANSYKDFATSTTESIESNPFLNRPPPSIDDSITKSIASSRANFIDPYDVKSIPVTQKEMRKQRKAQEQQQRLTQQQELERQQRENELMALKRAAIINAREQASQRKHLQGLHLEKFSVSHPSGTGDLFTDQTLELHPGARYGLIGKNGAGNVYLQIHILYVEISLLYQIYTYDLYLFLYFIFYIFNFYHYLLFIIYFKL
jgi:hypothetical protein